MKRANDAPAVNEIECMINNNNQVSYHVAVDDKEIIQAIPFNRNAWHCGEGGGSTDPNALKKVIAFLSVSKSVSVKVVAHVMQSQRKTLFNTLQSF